MDSTTFNTFKISKTQSCLIRMIKELKFKNKELDVIASQKKREYEDSDKSEFSKARVKHNLSILNYKINNNVVCIEDLSNRLDMISNRLSNNTTDRTNNNLTYNNENFI